SAARGKPSKLRQNSVGVQSLADLMGRNCSTPYGVVERCMLYPELRYACSGLPIFDALRRQFTMHKTAPHVV
ncbi:MAG: hypothetical protein LBK58_11535, partial [Prevotellaceae bacterium]|nr:hypothetical protein [Prevotellaceae bacterium]